MHLSVIIPAYNEEERITQTLTSVSEFLRRQSYTHEIIVVNDGSTDNTKTVVERNLPSCGTLIDQATNHGKGFAVRTGMLAATGEYRLFMDADSSTSIEHTNVLLPYLNSGYDIAISSRRGV